LQTRLLQTHGGEPQFNDAAAVPRVQAINAASESI
jgi:hypothetical protein